MFCFFPGVTPKQLAAVAPPIIVTEGEKKTIALWRLATASKKQPLFLTIGISGVWSWRGKVGPAKEQTGPIQDFDFVTWNGHIIYPLFDSDKKWNANVLGPECALAAELKSRGSIVKIVNLPDLPGLEKIGANDFLVHADGGPERLLRLIGQAKDFLLVLDPIDALPSARLFVQEFYTGEDGLILGCQEGS
jgi:hypothetical protein